MADPTITPKTVTVTPEMEAMVASIIAKQHKQKAEAAKPKEPNWATLTERQAMESTMYIPTVDHDLPDYMNMKLKDPEYEVVWASKDQRRLGQLAAEGYEPIKKEHVHPEFKVPLVFDSEGLYTYMDVIAMRVHKRILYAKRRKVLNITHDQLRIKGRLPSNRSQNAGQLGQGMELYESESSIA